MRRRLDRLPAEPVPAHLMAAAYDTGRDDHGWTVFDRLTGRVAVRRRANRSRLTWMEANDLQERLNRRHFDGDRSILQ